ncbi:MAG: dTDP-glucose 4,6-dehydratase [Deltaproteobacteria bacterium]|nr:dTDP-glucose 4,6-dehydratase [Deltaproteobacteria bacterium]
MKLLVTGAAGFIGSNFIHFLLAARPDSRIVGLDKLTYAGNLENLEGLEGRGRFSFVRGDIADREALDALFAERDFDAVVNFAAETHVDRSIQDPGVFLQTNVLGTQTLLDACRAHWQRGGRWAAGKRFVQISTDEVYGSLGPGEQAFREQDPLRPRNPYAASKAAADLLVAASCTTHGLPACTTRCSNNYGPYQLPEKLIPLMIRNALRHEPLPVYGDGRQVRDWLHVEDHCRAIALVLQKGRPGEVYHVGGRGERENIEVVEMLLAILARETGDAGIGEPLIRHVTDRPGHDRRYAMDASRIQRELGWQAQIDFEEGLARTVRWYLDHGDWIERVVSGEYLRFYELNYAGR